MLSSRLYAQTLGPVSTVAYATTLAYEDGHGKQDEHQAQPLPP
jgi:hypothetical protein